MQTKPLLKKGLAVGIILLFIGTCIIPSSGQKIDKLSLPRSRGNTLYVGGSGPGNYSRIQDAIDNASDGTTVFVFHGHYQNENITINKEINLMGENKSTTILDGRYNKGLLILVTSSNVTIRDFTIENSTSGTIFLYQTINLVGPWLENVCISDCIMKNNDHVITFCNCLNISISLCAIYQNYGQSISGGNSTDISIHNCSIHDNGQSWGGGCVAGGIHLGYCSNASVIDCQLFNNHGSGFDTQFSKNIQTYQNNISFNANGITFMSIENLEIHDNTIEGNPQFGIFDYGNDQFSDSTIYGNSILRNGLGIGLQTSQGYIITNNHFTENEYAIFAVGMDNIVVKNNSILRSTKAGIYLGSSNDCEILDNILMNNTEGLHIDFCNHCNFYGNIISHNDYGIHGRGSSDTPNNISNNQICHGQKGIYLSDASNFIIFRNEVTNNSVIAIWVNSSFGNIIFQNNFIHNGKEANISGSAGPFMLKVKNTWEGNYWSRPRIFPKLIFGFTKRWINKNWNHTYLVPKFEFDSTPAEKPWDIARE